MKVKKQHTHPGYYNAAGTRLPSVTTVAKLISPPEGLIHWAWDCGMKGLDYREVRDSAADAGTLAHSMIEADIKQLEQPSSEDEEQQRLALQGFNAYRSWREGSKFELHTTETVLVSERYQYGGRLDCVASVNGELCIVDWKTSKTRSPRDAWLPQIAAYRQGWNENHRGQLIGCCHLLQLSKADAGFSHHYFPSETIDLGWRAFLACLELYDCRKAVQKVL